MLHLQVAYEPHPISWVLPQHDGEPLLNEPPYADDVTLTVTAVEAGSGTPVEGTVQSVLPDEPFIVPGDPNRLSFQTNTPQVIRRLTQLTWIDLDIGFLPPRVRITAEGYDLVFLDLE